MANNVMNSNVVEAKIKEYWDYVYAGNQEGISELVSDDIEVEFWMAAYGNQVSELFHGKKQLLDEAKKIKGVIEKVLENQLTFGKASFDPLHDTVFIEVGYKRCWIIKKPFSLDKITSKGIQVWGFNKGVFISLNMKETERIKTRNVDTTGEETKDTAEGVDGSSTTPLLPAANAGVQGRRRVGCILL